MQDNRANEPHEDDGLVRNTCNNLKISRIVSELVVDHRTNQSLWQEAQQTISQQEISFLSYDVFPSLVSFSVISNLIYELQIDLLLLILNWECRYEYF